MRADSADTLRKMLMRGCYKSTEEKMRETAFKKKPKRSCGKTLKRINPREMILDAIDGNRFGAGVQQHYLHACNLHLQVDIALPPLLIQKRARSTFASY